MTSQSNKPGSSYFKDKLFLHLSMGSSTADIQTFPKNWIKPHSRSSFYKSSHIHGLLTFLACQFIHVDRNHDCRILSVPMTEPARTLRKTWCFCKTLIDFLFRFIFELMSLRTLERRACYLYTRVCDNELLHLDLLLITWGWAVNITRASHDNSSRQFWLITRQFVRACLLDRPFSRFIWCFCSKMCILCNFGGTLSHFEN